MKSFVIGLAALVVFGCARQSREVVSDHPYVVVLGIVQDAGYPQAGCERDCCERVAEQPKHRRMVSCIAVVDPVSREQWIFDATPDLPEQMHLLKSISGREEILPDGVFLTHAHIGHYTGLMHFGREAMGTDGVPVFALPKMTAYLEANGPWGQLVQLENILVRTLEPDRQLELNERVKVKPFLVPHRDEYSETVGYEITLGSKRVLFIPDIDKWQKWDDDIRERITGADLALLDGSFYADGEIQHRPMSEIPHPFVTESMALFDGLEPKVRSRIHFIHFNHTNPLLIEGSDAEKEVIDKGYQVARQGSVLTLSK